jgi:hypothetical protein
LEQACIQNKEQVKRYLEKEKRQFHQHDFAGKKSESDFDKIISEGRTDKHLLKEQRNTWAQVYNDLGDLYKPKSTIEEKLEDWRVRLVELADDPAKLAAAQSELPKLLDEVNADLREDQVPFLYSLLLAGICSKPIVTRIPGAQGQDRQPDGPPILGEGPSIRSVRKGLSKHGEPLPVRDRAPRGHHQGRPLRRQECGQRHREDDPALPSDLFGARSTSSLASHVSLLLMSGRNLRTILATARSTSSFSSQSAGWTSTVSILPI